MKRFQQRMGFQLSLILLTFLIVWTAWDFRQRAQLSANQRQQQVEHLAALLQEPLASFDSERLRTIMNVYARDSEVVEVHVTNDREPLSVKKSGKIGSPPFLANKRSQILVVQQSILVQATPIGTVSVTFERSAILELIGAVVWFPALAMLGIGALLAVFIHRTVIRPLLSAEHALCQIADGQIDQYLASATASETGLHTASGVFTSIHANLRRIASSIQETVDVLSRLSDGQVVSRSATGPEHDLLAQACHTLAASFDAWIRSGMAVVSGDLPVSIPEGGPDNRFVEVLQTWAGMRQALNGMTHQCERLTTLSETLNRDVGAMTERLAGISQPVHCIRINSTRLFLARPSSVSLDVIGRSSP